MRRSFVTLVLAALVTSQLAGGCVCGDRNYQTLAEADEQVWEIDGEEVEILGTSVVMLPDGPLYTIAYPWPEDPAELTDEEIREAVLPVVVFAVSTGRHAEVEVQGNGEPIPVERVGVELIYSGDDAAARRVQFHVDELELPDPPPDTAPATE